MLLWRLYQLVAIPKDYQHQPEENTIREVNSYLERDQLF